MTGTATDRYNGYENNIEQVFLFRFSALLDFAPFYHR